MRLNLYALAAGTVFIILFSWFLSLKYKRYHAIARFFVFESILILFLLNYRSWFTQPFSPVHILSWLFLLAAIWPVTDGFLTLTRYGKHDGNFENTSELVKIRIYKLIRHPLYLSLFLLGTGIMLKDPGRVQLILGLVNAIGVYFTARIEETEMIEKFGESYREYMKETKMFIPFLI